METILDPVCGRLSVRGQDTASFEMCCPDYGSSGGAGLGNWKLWCALMISILFHGALMSAPFSMNRTQQPRCEEVLLFMAMGGGAPAAPVGPVELPEKHPEEERQFPEPPPREPVMAEKVISKPAPVKPAKKKPVVKPTPKMAEQRPAETFVEREAPAQNAGPGSCEGQAPASAGPGPPGQGTAAHGPMESSFGASDGPRFLRRVLPHYPQLAREMGKEGTVLLRLTLDERGRLIEAVVVRGAGSGFDEQALRAVKESTFTPAKRDGRPVMCRANLPVKFILEGSSDD